MQQSRNPAYLRLFECGELINKINKAKEHLTECRLCPHECGVDRTEQSGFCRAGDKAVVASYGSHFGEEAPLVGRNGSGTIFFGYCNMRCVFCQNYELSHGGEGEAVTNEELAQIMLILQNNYKCHNINLVTPTHFVPNILEALYIAVQKGFNLPIVYNCGGYESIETLKLLDGIVDIYMPDFKYHTDERGIKYFRVRDYPKYVKNALKEMDRQVGGLKVDDMGVACRGLLIRHLVMPGGLEDTSEILKFIKEELAPDCLVNLMDQYRPHYHAYKYKEIARRLTMQEYREALVYAKKLGLRLV